jgi:glucosamine--fructose-6-phosphate aminotransferase (isomerizing)
MCGIFGYIGNSDPLNTCISGLELLEYRGYDSSGIAGIENGRIAICKAIGKLQKLKEIITPHKLELAIGHTRWATHGKVTQANAHPHFDQNVSIALVHNGIIENFDLLRRQLLDQGVAFASETDSEVIAQLIASNYQGDLLEAVQKSLPQLQGQFAIAVIHKDHPDQIVTAARESPLSIGYNDEGTESIISSDPNAFLGKSLNVLFLKDDEVARIQKGKIEIYSKEKKPILKKVEKLILHSSCISKEGYPHFLLKEIFEQPSTVRKALLGQICNNQVQLENFPKEFENPKNIWLIGCGTSAHAGAIGSFFFEDIANIASHSEIASEARYRIIPKETLAIALSQSGETADTLAAAREIKAKGIKVLGICNVKNSTLTRESNSCLFLRAGPEMSVCSTKAFTSQIAILYLLALQLRKKEPTEELYLIPDHIQEVLNQAAEIKRIAEKYARYNNFFFMGRRYMYPTAVEASLKLKELSYVNANAYSAGELKHGPIALIDENFPVIAFCANKKTEEKILSNLQEVKARGAPILAIAPDHLASVASIADDTIFVPSTIDELSPFASTVAGQLLAYYIALFRGCDIDQPRNLAKSVTVE